jgi:anti-sigma factor RsiW
MNVLNFNNHACKKIRSYLDSYLNDELMVETNHEVLKHLEECRECASELEARMRLKKALQSALGRDEAPAALAEKIRRDIRKSSAPAWRQWGLVAAALAVLVGGAVAMLQATGALNHSALPARTELAARSAEVLKIGLGDHKHCAIESGLSNRQFSAEQMAERMGPEYYGLVSLVKDKLPGAYRVVVGHRCRVGKREFIHMILKKDEAVLSLVITKKEGESFPQDDLAALIEAGGAGLRQARLDNLEVAGFETKIYLAFVVSNLDHTDNTQIASAIAPAVQDFLARLESEA